MKKMLSVLIACAILILTCPISPISLAWEYESFDRLITVGGKSVLYDMTLDDVIELFGEPKLTTGSMFGGKACTFYGENYSDYLYIETFEDGSIAAYGSVSPDFETDTLSFGDTTDGVVRHEYRVTDQDDKVFGLVRYRDFQSGLTDEYFENAVENNMNLCKHAVEMWNAVSYLYGYNTPTRFDEHTFYVSQQLADNCSDLYEYCFNTNQDSYFNPIGSGTIMWCGEYQYPNPLMFAVGAIRYECPEGFPASFIVRKTTWDAVCTSGGFVNPELFREKKVVPYTAEETELLKQVRETYHESTSMFNEGYEEGYYAVEPQFESLPLVGGMLNEKIAKGAVDFLNAIRIGARLAPLEYSRELSEGAQWKATLTRYIAKQGIPNPDPHNPDKPEGVSDEFYEKAMLGSGENLFMCGYFSTNVIGSLSYALDDSYGSGQYYARGHRYILLNPNWTEIGVGNTEQQGCHKTSGYRESDVEIVAWPSNGIMLAEAMALPQTMYTCKFYNGYLSDESTVVIVKCLNTDQTWRIAQDTLTSEQALNASGNLVSYTDSSIAFSIGNVYEITFENLLDSDGNRTSYTYRSVYEKAYVNEESDLPTQLTLSVDRTGVEIGESRKIKATVTPETAVNMMVKWSSSDPSVVTVNANGIVTGIANGSAVITAVTEEGQIKASCTVKVCSGHTWNGGTVMQASTCETEGLMTYTCTKCNATKQEVIAIIDHIFPELTYMNSEYHMGTCTMCLRSKAREHTWDDGKITKEPTQSSTGIKTYTCTGCGTTKTEKIEKLKTTAQPKVTTDPKTTAAATTAAPVKTTGVTTTQSTTTAAQPTSSVRTDLPSPVTSMTAPETQTVIPSVSDETPETNAPETSVSSPKTSTVPVQTSESEPVTTEKAVAILPNETSAAASSTDGFTSPTTASPVARPDQTENNSGDASSAPLYIVIGAAAAALVLFAVVLILIIRKGSENNRIRK